jgi:hypothetical protein
MSTLADSHGGRTPRRRWSRRRSGSFVAELLFVAPVLIVFLWAVIEFGIFASNVQKLSLASRVGAEAASEVAGLSGRGTFPPEVQAAIENQLHSSGITTYSARLEHNAGGPQTVLLHGTWGAYCEPQDVLDPPLPPGEYVRLSVCVPMSELMPNLLAVFGFDVNQPSRVANQTTVMRYEL